MHTKAWAHQIMDWIELGGIEQGGRSQPLTCCVVFTSVSCVGGGKLCAEQDHPEQPASMSAVPPAPPPKATETNAESLGGSRLYNPAHVAIPAGLTGKERRRWRHLNQKAKARWLKAQDVSDPATSTK